MKTRTQVKCTRLLVDSSQIMQFALKPGGGVAMQLVPVTDQEIEEYKSIETSIIKITTFVECIGFLVRIIDRLG